MEHVLPTRHRLARRGRALLRPRSLGALLKPTRKHVAIALLAGAALGGGFLWFRSSSLVAVQQVRVSGVSGVDAGPIEAALIAEAKRMSTLDASTGSLEAAVSRFRVVRSIEAQTSFPHTMRIHVHEQLPVAVLQAKSGETAVAADGVVLGDALASPALARISIARQPRTGSLLRQPRLHGYLTVLGAAPAPLLPLVQEVYDGSEGITAKMKGGLLVYFGDASRPHAKWDSLAAVLAKGEAGGALYIDVRVPERPSAGMPGLGAEESGEGGDVSATDPTSAALAESLDRAINGESPIESVSGEATAVGAVGGEEAEQFEEPPAEEGSAAYTQPELEG
jgi:cell division protein FtsQ